MIGKRQPDDGAVARSRMTGSPGDNCMARAEKSAYACRACGAVSLKWQGQCPECEAWNTLEESAPARAVARRSGGVKPAALIELAQARSEERRVGKGCVSKCKSRGAPGP